jgi:hypothetical protein
MPKNNGKKVTAEPTAATTQRPPTFKHIDDFFLGYANNIRFESTVYDLKLIFGETDLSAGNEVINQHTAITVPWALVKTTLYWLQLNLAIHELANGKVMVPPNQVPPPALPVPPEMVNDPNAHKAREIVAKLRQEFIDNL